MTQAGAEIARHLFNRSSKHAVMLLPSVSWAAMERREAGVRSVLSTMARPPAFHVVRCGDEGFDDTQAAFALHVEIHGLPDVVIGGNDRMAIAAMKFIQTLGLAVPADVRVTGFNGFDFGATPVQNSRLCFRPHFSLARRARARCCGGWRSAVFLAQANLASGFRTHCLIGGHRGHEVWFQGCGFG